MLLVALVAGACLGPADRDSLGQAGVERFLEAAAGGTRDRGWAALRPDAQTALQNDGIDAQRFATLVADAQWEDITWRVTRVTGDDSIACTVVDFSNGHLLPAVLVMQPGAVISGPEEDGEGTICVEVAAITRTVRITPVG